MLSKRMRKNMPASLASTIALAEKVVHQSLTSMPTILKERQTLAKAYYTLAMDDSISLAKAKLYLNSSILILRELNKKNKTWAYDIALAYQKRAEYLEEEDNLDNALLDYKKAIKVLEKITKLTSKDYTLLAECNLAVADILIYKSSSHPQNLNLSYMYANNAIKYLLSSNKLSADSLSCLIYAHQTAGIAASELSFNKALTSFRTALNIIYNSNIPDSADQVAETFRYLGIIYTFNSINEEFYPLSKIYEQCSTVYTELNHLLGVMDEDEIDVYELEELISTIAKINANPYLNLSVLQDLIDGLVYVNKHFQTILIGDSSKIQFNYYDGKNDFIETLPNLLTKVLNNLSLSYFRLTQTPIEKTFTAIQKQKYDYFQIAMNFYNQKPCKVFTFTPKVCSQN